MGLAAANFTSILMYGHSRCTHVRCQTMRSMVTVIWWSLSALSVNSFRCLPSNIRKFCLPYERVIIAPLISALTINEKMTCPLSNRVLYYPPM